MFSKDIISQSIIDAVSNVLQLDEKLNVKKRTTDTLAGRVKIPAAAGDNEHTAYKVELNAEELERVDEILDTSPAIKSYLDRSAVKRDALRNSIENKISHPDYDKTSNKIRKSFGGSDKAINKWNTINRTRSTSESVELDEENAVDKVTMDIPLLIRIMEYSKEDAKSDMDLHKVAEKLTELSASGKTLSMDCYTEIVGGITEGKRPEDDSVPFVTNEDGLSDHVDNIKKIAKHTFKKLKAHEEVELEEDSNPENLIADTKDRQSYLGHKKMEQNHINQYKKAKSPIIKGHHQDMIQQHSDAADGILDKYRKEEVELDEKVWDSDGRTTTELKKQVRGLGDDQLKNWSKNPKSIFDTKTKKVQDRIISHEVKNRGKVKESYDDEDPDVARADRELARMKAKPIKADRKTDPSKEMSKLSKRAPKEDDDELDKDLTHKEEFELGESVRSDRKKSTMAVLDRIYKKASENTKLEQNRKISPKLPKKELDEAKKDSYQIYHPSYSSAVQHAEKHLNKQGFDIHPDDWFHHVNAGPSKPSEGKTVSLHIPLHKDGVPSKKVAHIQVYNRGNDLANNHELNMYHN
jgi:hypothetical protein